MKSKLFFVVILFWVLFIATTASCQQEEITLSTYYPAPYGEYDELCAEKLLVWRPDATELQYMGEGDCHIGNSLIVGAGATGFSYEEIGGSLTDGTVLIKGNVGIGTTGPSQKLHILDNVATNIPSLLVQNNGARASLRLLGRSTLDTGATSANLQFYDQATADNAHLVFENANPGDPLAVWIGGTRRLGIYATPGLSVGSYSGTVPPTDGMIIPGNLGIGTTSPGYKLDVNGDINFPATGFLRIAGNAGSSGQALTRTATGMAWQISGKIVGTAYNSTNSTMLINVAFPRDNTIPQITEGLAIPLSLVYTPQFSDSIINVEVVVNIGGAGGDSGGVVALFRTGNSNALATAVAVSNPSDADGHWSGPIFLRHQFVPGSTSPIDFRVRMGYLESGIYLNRVQGSIIYGGTMRSHIYVTEIRP